MSSTVATESSTIVSSLFNGMTSTTNVPAISKEEAAPIFLQTRAAQGIAGAFVWAALFLTCQQVFCDNEFLERSF